MGQAERLSRRSFIDRAAKSTLAVGLLTRLRPEYVKSPEHAHQTLDILGGHDTPTNGGSRNPELLFHDVFNLGMQTLVCIDPSSEIIQKAQASGTRLITRIYQKDNIFDEFNVRWTLNKFEQGTDTIFQIHNEPNLEGAPLDPEELIHHHFMPAARLIVEKGAKVLLTPVAPFALFKGMTYDMYHKRQLQQLVNEFDNPQQAHNWIRHNVVEGIHAYSFHTGGNPYNSVLPLAAVTQEVLGFQLPIEITEGGLSIDYPNQYTPDVIASETQRLAQIPIPDALRGVVRSFCLWLIANSAQRNDVDITSENLSETELHDYLRFDDAALRKGPEVTSVSPAYNSLVELTTI